MQSSLLEEVLAGRAPALRQLSVTQVRTMIEHGVLGEGEPIELIDGFLVRKNQSDTGGDPMIHGPRHALCIKRLLRLERKMEFKHFHLHCQLPIRLADDLEPEPDGALVRGSAEDYADHHPVAADIFTVIEVADSSLEYDRTTKQRIYASSSIPAYLIVNIRDRQIELYELPDAEAGSYDNRLDFREGEMISIGPSGDRLTAAVSDLLP